jgi:hypothetical protein
MKGPNENTDGAPPKSENDIDRQKGQSSVKIHKLSDKKDKVFDDE